MMRLASLGFVWVTSCSYSTTLWLQSTELPRFADRDMAWKMWNMSKTYNSAPSAILGIKNRISAYYLDNGYYLFGQFIEGKLNEAEARVRRAHKGKSAEPFINNTRQRTFNLLMGKKDQEAAGFRSPGFFDDGNKEAKLNTDKNTVELGDDFFG